MKKFVLILILVMVSNYAVADWINSSSNDRSVTYIDTNIQKTGNTSNVFVLFDYKKIQESSVSGRKYLSEKSHWEIDCSAMRARTVSFTWYAGQMGNGDIVYSSDKPRAWDSSPSAAGSIGEGISNIVCH